MQALFVKIFAERNCGGTELARDIRRGWSVTLLRGAPEFDRVALRETLKSVPPRERAALHNHLLDMEHDRILYSDFGWTGTAPALDIIQSAAHAADTLFLGVSMHPLAFATGLATRPRTPGAPSGEMPLPDWLAQPFPVHRRDGLEDVSPRPPLALWSAKARALLRLAESGRKVVLLRAEAPGEADLEAHLVRKDGTAPAIGAIDVPAWESALRQVPARLLREIRFQLDPGVLRALGHEPI